MSRDVKFIEHQCPYREALGDAIEVDEGTRCVMDDGGKEELVPPPAVDPMVAEGGAAAARAAGAAAPGWSCEGPRAEPGW